MRAQSSTARAALALQASLTRAIQMWEWLICATFSEKIASLGLNHRYRRCQHLILSIKMNLEHLTWARPLRESFIQIVSQMPRLLPWVAIDRLIHHKQEIFHKWCGQGCLTRLLESHAVHTVSVESTSASPPSRFLKPSSRSIQTGAERGLWSWLVVWDCGRKRYTSGTTIADVKSLRWVAYTDSDSKINNSLLVSSSVVTSVSRDDCTLIDNKLHYIFGNEMQLENTKLTFKNYFDK